jgi:hypothetical protein
LSWIFGYKLFKYLKDSETGKGIETSDLKGKICKVTLPVKKEQKGKIIVYLEENYRIAGNCFRSKQQK